MSQRLPIGLAKLSGGRRAKGIFIANMDWRLGSKGIVGVWESFGWRACGWRALTCVLLSAFASESGWTKTLYCRSVELVLYRQARIGSLKMQINVSF